MNQNKNGFDYKMKAQSEQAVCGFWQHYLSE